MKRSISIASFLICFLALLSSTTFAQEEARGARREIIEELADGEVPELGENQYCIDLTVWREGEGGLGESSITHSVKIRQGSRIYFVALDGSGISPQVIDRILESIEVSPPAP